MSILRCAFLAVFVFSILSCATRGNGSMAESETETMIDDALRSASADIIDVVPPDADIDLAVYYFTTGEEKSSLSDYIMNSLTTSLANDAAFTVVSRQALDRLMQEYSYQLSDLVDSIEQVQIGKQLGADLIVTGFITPLAHTYELNIQVLSVESGEVLGGSILEFRLPPTFADSAVVSAEKGYAVIEGSGVRTIVYEDFEGGFSDMSISHEEERWGDRVLRSYGKTAVTPGETTTLVRYDFGAEFDHLDLLDDWEDSDTGYYLRVDTNLTPGDFDGVAFTLTTENCAQLYISVRQFDGNDPLAFSTRFTCPPGKPREVRLPFRLLHPEERKTALDTDKPFQIEVYTNFMENHTQFYLREGTTVSGAISMDDIGLFTKTGADFPHVVESFDEDYDKSAVSFSYYGVSSYWDYEESDDGVAAVNQNVENLTLAMDRQSGGPAGSYLATAAMIETTGNLADAPPLQALFWISTAADYPSYSTLSFFVRSNIVQEGSLEFQDLEFDRYYYASDFSVGNTWSRIRVDLDEAGIYGVPRIGNVVVLYFSFDLHQEIIASGVQDGVLQVDISIDDLILENR